MIYDINSDIYHSTQDMRKEIVAKYATIAKTMATYVKDTYDLPLAPVSLILAVIAVESKGNPYATRFEPDFSAWLNTRISDKDLSYLLPIKAGLVSRPTEMCQRATSFGLMQILGQTAREQGFKGIYMTELCDVETNLHYCIKYLARLLKQHTVRDHAIASYNAGSVKRNKAGNIVNQVYIDKVVTEEMEFIKLLNDVEAVNV